MQKQGKNPGEAYKILLKAYGGKAMSISRVYTLFNK